MSMREYGVSDYGLIIDAATMKHLASMMCQDYSDNGYIDDPWGYNEEVAERVGAEYISEFSGDAVGILDDGRDGWNFGSEVYCGDPIYYIPLKNYPGLFRRAYKDINECINEVVSKVGQYLPGDFNIRNNIRHIVGTYYG